VKRLEFKAHREEKDFPSIIRRLSYHPLDELESFDLLSSGCGGGMGTTQARDR
jgi:hypothetical protein